LLQTAGQVENQLGCCSPAMNDGLPVLSCCGSESQESQNLHGQLRGLFTRYNVNDYAASVKVYAVKVR
jgi:arsenite methyltransferase